MTRSIALQAVGPNNSVRFPDGLEVNLDDLEPVELFSHKAKCSEGKDKVLCPEPTVFSKKMGDGTKVTVAKNGSGDIEKIRKSNNNGKSQVLQAVDNGVFTHIPPEAVDNDFFSKFTLKHEVAENIRGHVNRQLRDATTTTKSIRGLQSACTEFKEVEVAVAIESSFCADIGASNVDAKVQSIIDDVAEDYEQEGLCFTARMSHYEKHCDPNDDPYKAGVALNQSGCGNDGL